MQTMRNRTYLTNAVAQYRASVGALKQPRPKRTMTPEGRFWLGYVTVAVAAIAIAIAALVMP